MQGFPRGANPEDEVMTVKSGVVAVAALLALGSSVSRADSIGEVENARAMDRAGYALSRGEYEKLHRYGGNDDDGYATSGYADDDGAAYDDDLDDDEANYVGDAEDDGPYVEED
jgi:hypothetical protein